MATYTLFQRFGAITQRARLLIIPTREQIGLFLRGLALLFALVFGGLTASTLLWDVRGTGDLTLEHYGSVGAMIGAFATGLFFIPALRWRKWLVALGLAIGWTATTTVCVVSSGGRIDQLMFERNAAARQVNQDRERAQRNRDEAHRRYDAALEAETSECSGGAGRKCLAKREITQDRRTDLEVAELLLQKAKPEQRENGKLKRAAEIIALFSTITEERAEHGLTILWPYMGTFTWELLTIVFGHLAFAFGHGKKDLPEAKARDCEPRLRKIASKVPQSSAIRVPTTAMVVEALEKAKRPLANYELAALIGCSEGECSRRVAKMNGQLERQRVGHCIMISLAKPQSSAR